MNLANNIFKIHCVMNNYFFKTDRIDIPQKDSVKSSKYKDNDFKDFNLVNRSTILCKLYSNHSKLN